MEEGTPNMLNVRSKLEAEEKEKLERAYGVRIHGDALNLTCDIVEKELKASTDKWDQFMQNWKPLLQQKQQSSERWGQEIHLLQQVHQELLSFLPEQGGVHWLIDSVDEHGMLGRLDALVTLLSKGIPQNFEEVVTVGPHLIAKVASPLTGVPASWLLHSSKPPLKGLVSRLLRTQLGKDHPIRTIAWALKRASRPRPPRPIGSLLWLCGLRSGGPELAEALAEELFDSRDSLIHLDLSEYTDPHSVSRLLGVPTSQGQFGAVGQLTEAVKKKPFSVVLFSNIDVAHASVIDTLIEISSNGKLTDGQGSTIDFTNTLVIMISRIESDKQVTFSCDCLRTLLKEFPVKEFLDHHSGKTEHLCCILPRLRKVQRQFKFQLYQQLDDIVVFSSLYVGHCKAIARLRLRDIASSMIRRGIVIYPSEAALDSIVLKASWYTTGEKPIRDWLEENLVPALVEMCAKGEINDNYIIYIDTLVGTMELSYRLVNGEVFVVDQILKQFKESSTELRVLCREEKERIKRIYMLRRKYYELISVVAVTDFEHVASIIRELVSLIDLMIKEIDVNRVADEEMVVQTGMNEEAELRQIDGPNKRAKKGVENLKARLSTGLSGQAIDIVAGAILKIINAPQYPPCHPVASSLLLGLTPCAKAELVKEITDHFITDDGANLLIQFNLVEYTDSDSLSHLMDALSRYTGSKNCELQLPEAVRIRPCSILLFNQVEKAHISVFSALLSVLDDGIFNDNRGRTVDCRDTIVIITSEVGHKEIIARVVGHASENTMREGDIKQEEVRGFRHELLNRIDEIVFFHPFADDQLRRFVRLSMRVGAHLELEGRIHSALPVALLLLFKPPDDPDFDIFPPAIELAVSHLSKGLIEHDGSSSSAAVQ